MSANGGATEERDMIDTPLPVIQTKPTSCEGGPSRTTRSPDYHGRSVGRESNPITKENTMNCDSADTLASSRAGQESMMSARRAEGDGVRCVEAPCSRCFDHFAFALADERLVLLDRSLSFFALAQDYQVHYCWEVSGHYDNDDREGVWQITELARSVGAALGLFALDIRQVRGLRGSLELSLASEVFPQDQQTAAADCLAWLDEFAEHVQEHHCSDPASLLRKPDYLGVWTLDEARSWSPKLKGKTLEEIETIMDDSLRGLADEVRSDVRCHLSRRADSHAVMEQATWNALDVIESKAHEWSETINNSPEAAGILYARSEMHNQVYVIDEAVKNGCIVDCKGRFSTMGGLRVLEIMKQIGDLIDWDQCEALKAILDKAGVATGSDPQTHIDGIPQPERSPDDNALPNHHEPVEFDPDNERPF